MTDSFKKLMRQQIQERVNKFLDLTMFPAPKSGWIKTIRNALGMTSYQLAKRMGSSRTNISKIEKSEQKGSISLAMLEQIAQTLNCKLVYCLVPVKPFDKILEDRAKMIAKKKIGLVNYSMILEQQGLTSKQLEQQEIDLVHELLQENPKKLWEEDDI